MRKACNFVEPFIGKYWWRRRDDATSPRFSSLNFQGWTREKRSRKREKEREKERERERERERAVEDETSEQRAGKLRLNADLQLHDAR